MIMQINSGEVAFVSSDKGFDLFNHTAVLFCDYICIDWKSKYIIIWLAIKKLKYYIIRHYVS